MSLPTRRKKRSSSTNSPRKRTSAPKKRKRAKKRKPAKRSAPKKRKATSKKRSAAAKKGWAKRRKKQKLIDAMVDIRLKRNTEDPLPLGWIERRAQLRMMSGKMWRRVIVTYDEDLVRDKRLETLRDLEIDMLGKDDLYNYLAWTSAETGIDISDMYRMYLGYPLEGTTTIH